MSLPFDPACAPLLLGSLPHQNAAQALEATRRYTGELVAWPQLWQCGFREQLVPQGAVGFPGVAIDDAARQVYVVAETAAQELERLGLAYLENRTSIAQLGERDAAGFFALLRQGGTFPKARAFKGQMLGPISLAMQLTDEQHHPLIYDPVLFDAVTQFVRLRMVWQEQQLIELNRPTIMFLDEPFLEMVGSPFLPISWDEAQAQIDLALQDVIGCRAIFTGGAVDWGHLLRLGVDLVSGDVLEHPSLLLGAAEMLAEFVSDGGLIGFGLVPADTDALSNVTAEWLVNHLSNILAELEQTGIDVERLLRQSVVMPNGALGSLSVGEAERALAVLAETSSLLRERYGLHSEK